MSARNTAHEYLKVKVQTADRTELLLMLVDGAVKFASQAIDHMQRKEFEDKNTFFIKAQNIVLELLQALNPTVGEELYDNLTGLYRFCYERLIHANLKDDLEAAREAVKILEHIRDTWRLAVEKYHEEKSPPPPARVQSSLCVEG